MNQIIIIKQQQQVIIKLEKRLTEEKERADSYIPKKYTPDLLMNTCEHELIGRYLDTMIENKDSGPYNMFIHRNIDSLRRMYKLFMRIDTKNIKLQESMYKYIRESAEKIVN